MRPRDGHQSLWPRACGREDAAHRPKLDAVGYWSLEVWGGATFDTSRFLKEDPWERLPRWCRHAQYQAPNVLPAVRTCRISHYADDVLEHHRTVRRHGIDVRIFDALNDIRNVERAMREVKPAVNMSKPPSAIPSVPSTA
jgi:pyruvate carboxylase subunit B